jgi:hypothetical protein
VSRKLDICFHGKEEGISVVMLAAVSIVLLFIDVRLHEQTFISRTEILEIIGILLR